MLDADLKTQLKAYLERLTQPIELVASLDDRPASQEMRELLEEIYRTNQSENRKSAWMRVIPGVVLFVVFWVVFAATGRLYYLILGGSGLSLAWGVASLLMANGYEVEVDEGED
jgi:hypothetical protein